MSVTATAKVTMIIQCGSNWSDGTTMEQIIKQAKKGAEKSIMQMVSSSNCAHIISGGVKIERINVKSELED